MTKAKRAPRAKEGWLLFIGLALMVVSFFVFGLVIAILERTVEDFYSARWVPVIWTPWALTVVGALLTALGAHELYKKDRDVDEPDDEG